MERDDLRHGTNAGYSAGCRDSCCHAAKIRYDKTRRWELHKTGEYRKVPAWRALRRVRALQRLGWSVPVLAARLGLKHQAIYGIGRGPTMYRSTFDRIAAMYDELCMKVPDPRTASEKASVTKTRRHAEAMGWPPPLAWDDIDDPNEFPLTRPPRMPVRGELGVTADQWIDRIQAGQKPGPHWPERSVREEIVATWQRRTGKGLHELARLTGWKPERYRRAA